MKATQGHRATPAAPDSVVLSYEVPSFTVEWNEYGSPSSVVCELWDAVSGLKEIVSVGIGIEEADFTFVGVAGRSYFARVRSAEGGEMSAPTQSNTVAV
jgi:hypothetical protein